MKSIIFLVLLMCSTWVSYAQVNPAYDPEDCNLDISTNPENPYHPKYLPGTGVSNVPGNDQHLFNTFDWTSSNYPAKSCVGSVFLPLEAFTNPFYQIGNPSMDPVRKGQNSDFYPEDGWELVKRDMGLLMRPGQIEYGFADDQENGLRNLLNTQNCVYYVIQQNGHLPNIPSQAELNANGGGFEIGDMTRLQQEKIEELFLYIIQMENRINELEAKLDTQEETLPNQD